MAAWDHFLNAPVNIGDDFICSVEKPAAYKRVAGGYAGSGTAGDPFKLKYVLDETSANSVDPWRLLPKAMYTRTVHIWIIRQGLPTKKTQQVLQDTNSGG